MLSEPSTRLGFLWKPCSVCHRKTTLGPEEELRAWGESRATHSYQQPCQCPALPPQTCPETLCVGQETHCPWGPGLGVGCSGPSLQWEQRGHAATRPSPPCGPHLPPAATRLEAAAPPPRRWAGDRPVATAGPPRPAGPSRRAAGAAAPGAAAMQPPKQRGEAGERLLLPGTQAPNVGHRAINTAAGPQAPQVVFVACVCLFIELRCPKTGGRVGWGCCSTSNRQRLSTKESFQPQRGHGAAATYGQRGKR